VRASQSPRDALATRGKVKWYFETDASYWRDVYGESGTQAEVFRDRHAGALDWIAELGPARGASALEVGCGAAYLAVELVRRGMRVEAIDNSPAMVELARRTAAEAGVADDLHVAIGDVHHLSFPDESFDLVVAIAVLPWIARVPPAVAEMARVLRPGGHLIITADNRDRLNTILDPRYNLVLAPLRVSLGGALARLGLRRASPYPSATYHGRGFIDRSLAAAGLDKVKGRTIGFGPFTFFGRGLTSARLGTSLHHRLQRLADRGAPVLSATGAHYLVLARKAVRRE
jgi:SAM-dependent methyltransferase